MDQSQPAGGQGKELTEALHIRAAQRGEAETLSALALASKASWGYPAEMVEAFVEELTLAEAAIVENTVAVCVSGDEILGFYRLVVEGREGEVADCFVSPEAQRRGVGAALMSHLMAAAKAAGVTRLELQSDPYAEGFYAAMGFKKFSQSESDSIPGRYLPVMEMKL